MIRDFVFKLSIGCLLVITTLLHSQVQYDAHREARGTGLGRGKPEPQGLRPLRSELVAEALTRFHAELGPDAEATFLGDPARPAVLSGFSHGGGFFSTPEDYTERTISFAESWSDLLDIPNPRASLSLSRVHVLEGMTIVKLEQTVEGLPVLGAGLTSFFDDRGALRALLVAWNREARLENAGRISETAAIRSALVKLREDPGQLALALPLSRVVIAKINGRCRAVWDLKVNTRSGSQRVIVDASTGETLGSASRLRHLNCTPRPKGNGYVESPSKGPPVALELSQLDCRSTLLNGEFIRTFEWLGSNPFTYEPIFEFGIRGSLSNGQVTFNSQGPAEQAQVTLFHHATRFHDWFQGLGFHDLDRPFPTVANAAECYDEIPCENAFFSPDFPYSTGYGALVFGYGPTVNFALEADVICHEYTHGVVANTSDLGSDFFDPGYFYSSALNEAFADYFSSTFIGDPHLGEYSGRAFGRVPLRNLDNTLRWPQGIDPESFHDTGQIWGGALWEIRQAFSENGNDSAGVGEADRLAYATLLALDPESGFLAAAQALVAAAQARGLSPGQIQTAREVLEKRGLLSSQGEPPLTVARLSSGVETAGDVAAVTSGEIRFGSTHYEIVVPGEASKLTLELQGTQDVDLYVRFNSPVDDDGPGGAIVATARSESPSSAEVLEITRAGAPPLSRGSWFIAVANRKSSITSYRLKATLELTSFESLSPLSPGQPQSGSVPGGPVLTPVQFTFELPASAGKRMTISVTGNQDCDLYLRRGKPVEVGVEGGIAADAVSKSPANNEVIALDESSLPGLEAGTYYAAIRNAASGPLDFTIEASIANVAPPVLATEALTPGVSLSGSAPAALPGSLRLSEIQYTVQVPDDGSKLVARLTSAADLALYLRSGERVVYEGGHIAYDHLSDLPATGNEAAIASLLSSPRLAPGTYFLGIANHDAVAADFDLVVDLETAPSPATIVDLPNAQWLTVQVPGLGGKPAPVLSTTQYRVRIAADSPGLDVLTNPSTAGDVDLYIRRDRPVQRIPEGVVADWRSETTRAAEALAVFKEDLTPGDYYIALGSRSAAQTTLDVIAVFEGRFPISVPVEEDDEFQDVMSAANGGCTLSLNQFAFRVPANATRLEVDVTPLDGGPLNVLVRHGGRILIDRGAAVFDDEHREVAGTIVYSGLNLKPGVYFFAIANCVPSEQAYTISGRVRIPGSAQELLVPGIFTDAFLEPASPGAPGRLGATQYFITIPAEARELLITAQGGACAEEDVDLLVKRGARVEWNDDETSNADWRSARLGGGAETVVINSKSTPKIGAGTYYVALVNRQSKPVAVRIVADGSPLENVPIESGKVVMDTIATSGQAGVGLLQSKQYRIEIPPGSASFKVDLAPRGAAALDIDLYVRFGATVFIGSNGTAVADQRSETQGRGVESIQFPAGAECLLPGVYFLAVGNFAASAVPFDLKATVEGGTAKFRRGDANEDGEVNLSDAVSILNYLFRGGTTICLDGGDTEVNGEINLTDAVFLLQYLFLGGKEPKPPFPDCGSGEGEPLGECSGQGCE